MMLRPFAMEVCREGCRKRQRQIFLTTHNPNLAVVCDAEQVIYTDRVGEEFTYIPVAVEDPPLKRGSWMF